VSASPAEAPVFYYDLYSPYAYLAALRVDDVLPVEPVWRPILFGALLRQTGRVPWSLSPGREEEMAAIARRAEQRGLPPLRWPPGWPVDTYSVTPVRAALVAEEAGRLRPVSRELYAQAFVKGHPLDSLDHVLEAAAAGGLDPEEVRVRIEDPQIKARVREYTAEASERGVQGIPTVAIGLDLHWGDDRLEAAAAALA